MNQRSGKKAVGKTKKRAHGNQAPLEGEQQSEIHKLRDAGFKAEASLRDVRKMDELLRTTLDSMSDGFMILESADLIVRVFNKSAELLLSRKAGDVLEKPLFESFPEARGSIFDEKYYSAFTNKQKEEFETYFGVEPYTAWYTVRVFPAENSICVFFQVITDQKEKEEELKAANQQLVASNQQLRAAFQQVSATEQQLRASNQQLIAANQQLAATEKQLKGAYDQLTNERERLDLIIRGSNDAPWDWDLKTNELFYSDRYWEQLGYAPGELAADAGLWRKLAHPDDIDEVNAFLEKELKSDRTNYAIEFRLKHKAGHYINILSRGIISRDNSGKPVRITGSNMDLTEQKKTAEHNRNIVMNSTNMFYTHNENHEFTYVSPQSKEFLGISPDEAKTRWTEFITDNPVNNEGIELTAKAIRTGKQQPPYQLELRRKDGSTLWVEVNERPNIEDGKVTGITGSLTNINELKHALEESIAAREKAEQSDRLKSAFLANMSHEIRTPMNGILGFANLLKKQGLNAEVRSKYIDIINQSGVRMLDTINNLVDISKIEAGLVELHISKENIHDACLELRQFFLPEAETKGLKLEFTTRLERENSFIETDKEKLTSVLTNLVKNAIKFTHQGGITFGYSLKKRKGGEYLDFFVEDTGVGIPAEMVGKVFDRFTQVERETKKVYEGSGLGLSISKSYIEMLGGTIKAESEYGKGTKFSFTVPIGQKGSAKKVRSQPYGKLQSDNWIKDASVLIAEDEEVSDQLLTELLEPHCKTIQHARTGREVVEIMKTQDGIDIILMDIRMPEMDGYEATMKIREFNKEVIIIAQTAFAIAGDRQKAFAAGCDEHITKPVNEKELLIKIYDQYERRFMRGNKR